MRRGGKPTGRRSTARRSADILVTPVKSFFKQDFHLTVLAPSGGDVRKPSAGLPPAEIDVFDINRPAGIRPSCQAKSSNRPRPVLVTGFVQRNKLKSLILAQIERWRHG